MTIRKMILLAAAFITLQTAIYSSAQQAPKFSIKAADVAALFNLEHGQAGAGGFWLKGGSIDGSLTMYKGLSLAANLTGEHASNISNGVSLGKIAFMAGPRYTVSVSSKYAVKRHDTRIFGEWLFGGVQAFDSVFPGSPTIASRAGAFSMQFGGGVDIALSHHFGLRVPEIDLVHTNLPNNGSGSQNDLRLAFGASYRR
jgi:hypothetical protein